MRLMTDSPPTDTVPRQTDQLFALVYEELRRIARNRRRQAGSPVTLDTTALINETYLKLASAREAKGYSRAHFLSLAARAMRQVLVDHARNRARYKRGGDVAFTTLGMTSDSEPAQAGGNLFEVLALDRALADLAALDAESAQLVEWHVFGGLTIEEIAQLQNINVRTAFRRWRSARAFLVQQLGRQDDPDGQHALATDHHDL
jgi:RNA polymerase sigma factor (TIGR02999 family)